MISEKDRGIIRDLARRYAEASGSEHNRLALARWRKLNNLQSERPVVQCNTYHLLPEIEWS